MPKENKNDWPDYVKNHKPSEWGQAFANALKAGIREDIERQTRQHTPKDKNYPRP